MSDSPTFRQTTEPDDLQWCAELMASLDPWLTFGRDAVQSRQALENPLGEVWLAMRGEERLGFALLIMQGAFVGYVQSLAMAPAVQGQGVGSRLLTAVEERVFTQFPNVFICASSFNPRARELYRRRGYLDVGTLTDYIVAGHDEHLLRKSRGPKMDYPTR